ncbi:hypothetical protein C121_28 [Stenotrophomonas phage C121]|uniref:hypothetical protein n=1 Tax=Stenotrophomonas phage C121 TaxID=2914029 RepID=UPI0023295C1A|nr:hypothetical protein PP752_gp28 [Stenotrophomonas phage C121]UKL14761.1 hypothetical protein C121_28 [Stenotrophomonas phage C121]
MTQVTVKTSEDIVEFHQLKVGDMFTITSVGGVYMHTMQGVIVLAASDKLDRPSQPGHTTAIYDSIKVRKLKAVEFTV